VDFIVEASGERKTGAELASARVHWLWFRPDVVPAIFAVRGSVLDWNTAFTGRVGCSPAYKVEFGINPLGLLTVLAKDIGELPEWHQRLWVSHNVAPDGGISKELRLIQNEQKWPDTQAPENFLKTALNRLNDASKASFDIDVIRPHKDFEDILDSCHRFRAHDKASLYSLAKDIARVTADSIDAGAINAAIKIKENPLKALQALVALKLATRMPTSCSGRCSASTSYDLPMRTCRARMPTRR